MLFPQIDQTSRSAGGEIGFDLKLVKASRKSSGRLEQSIHEKLTAVEDWIYAHDPVGTIDDPEAWIYGHTNLNVAVIDKSGNTPEPDRLGSGAVLYTCRSKESGSPLILGGSARHLIGEGNHVPTTELDSWYQLTSSGSSLHGLILKYAEGFDGAPEPPADGEVARQMKQYSFFGVVSGIVNDFHIQANMPAAARANLAEMADREIRVRKGHYEFLAKRLNAEELGPEGPKATLATPLFVALAD